MNNIIFRKFILTTKHAKLVAIIVYAGRKENTFSLIGAYMATRVI